MSSLRPVADEATRPEAQARAERIRAGIAALGATLEDISEAYRRRDWAVLDYASWDAYVSGEFGTDRVRLPPEQRREMVASLRTESMSMPAIASVLGVGVGTIDRDLAAFPDGKPQPIEVIGSDGKTYAPTQPPRLQDEPEIIEAELIEDDEPERPPTPQAIWSQAENDLLAELRAGKTIVANFRVHPNLIQWATDAFLFERIDRRTEWGNPFEMPGDGDRETVIRSYSEGYWPRKFGLHDRVAELRGKALGCWCAPEPCHGDLLKEKAEAHGDL